MANITESPPRLASRISQADLTGYKRIAILTEGLSTHQYAKTAMSLLRYRRQDIVAILDASQDGKCAGDLFGIGDSVPVVASLDDVGADSVFVGTASPGGKLPEAYRNHILSALARGIDVISGLHDFLSTDPEFLAAADAKGASLIDVRRNNENATSIGQPFRRGCLRIHTVGQDCSLGKMVTSLEVQIELVRRGLDAKFVATGQTGIMVDGDGVPVDCVVSDFVNGAVEALVRRNEDHDILLIEGQGSISHPSFSGVTMGLLHGCAPDGLIYCYEVGRKNVKGLEGVPLVSHRRLIDAYESIASLRYPSRVIGIAMNSRFVSAAEAELERERMASEFGLPVCDVYRHGSSLLADAVLALKRELGK